MAKKVSSKTDAKVGVLLVNLGTPDGYDKKSMRRYLAEFLSDPRVIERPRWFWLPILHGVILNFRPKKSGVAYQSIWNKEKDESPLRTFTRAQSDKLAIALKDLPGVIVDWGMRYGTPSIAERIEKLTKAGCERIVVFALYPQYSATTTASVSDKTFQHLFKMRKMPSIRTIGEYYKNPVYIRALAKSIKQHLKQLDHAPEKIIASYHGLPKTYIEKGDPYYLHCIETTKLVNAELGWDDERLITCFQSRFGPEEWLTPYMDKTIEELGANGIKNIAVISPGFVSDCVETLEEIAIEGEEIFHKAGGENFTYIACLNDSKDGIAVIEDVVRNELKGWV